MRIGVLGGGQLGRMLGLAGLPLGLEFTFLDPAAEACAAAVGLHLQAEYTDPRALEQLLDTCWRITYEFENVPVEAATHLARRVAVYPPPVALEVAQDRLREKQFFRSLEIPTARFLPADSPEQLWDAVQQVGLPAVVKTRRFGYDGKGQRVVRELAEVAAVWHALGGHPLLVEEFVAFRRELSVLAVRDLFGHVACYPVVENHHEAGILRVSLAPAPDLRPGLAEAAERYARRALAALDYVGVLCIELFETAEGLVANELAPRVHNSGHWTIEGAHTSQFANHVRAVAGLPLGCTRPRACCAMVNLIGQQPDATAVLRVSGAHFHWYGKALRPGRKVGHVTVCVDRYEELPERLEQLRHSGVYVPKLRSPVG